VDVSQTLPHARHVVIGPNLPGARALVRKVLVVLLCMLGVAAGVDVLSASIVPNEAVVPWWGAPESSNSSPTVLADEQFPPASCNLLLSVKNSQLTATYTLTAAGRLAKSLNAAHDAGVADSQVLGLIDNIDIAEFDRGFTGRDHTWKQLVFSQPQLSITSKNDEIKVTSYPVELQLNTQLMTMFQKQANTQTHIDQISIQAKGLQLNKSSGMIIDSMSANQVIASPTGDRSASFAITENDPKSELLMLLRASGGIFIPIFNNLLSGLGTYLIYILLLLGLTSAARSFPGNRVIAASRDVLFIIVAAFITGYALELMTEINERIPAGHIRTEAGPIGLLLAGIVLVWPTACLAAGRDGQAGQDTNDKHPARKSYLLIVLGLITELAAYWIAAYAGWQVNPLAHPAGLAAGAFVGFLTVVLAVEILPRAGKLLIGLIAGAGLAILLTASVFAPILSQSIFNGDHFREPHVNVGGKLIYLTAAILLFGGLAVLSYRIVQSLGYKPQRRWLTWSAITLLIGITIIPNTVENSQISAAHTQGTSVSAFFGLIFSLPQLLDWLLLALAVTAVMSLPETPVTWPSARYIAIPISLLLLYGNVTWLYIPVTLIIGTVTVAVLLLPRKLTTVMYFYLAPSQAVKKVIAARRRSALAADQSQRLNARAGKMPNDFRKSGPLSYEEAFRSLTLKQEFLSAEQDKQNTVAQALKVKAFGYYGCQPDKKMAKHAALIGAFLGIIPAAVSIITRQNLPSDSPYFFLQFFGGAAWGIFIWPLLGWFIGYFCPIIRGCDGTTKAAYIISASLIGSLPMDIVWNTAQAWLNFLVNLLVFGSFVMVSCVIICELMTLKTAGMGAADWIKVHNWRFIVSWSAALLAALGTAGVTFLSTAATDLSHQTVTVVTGTSSEYNSGSGR